MVGKNNLKKQKIANQGSKTDSQSNPVKRKTIILEKAAELIGEYGYTGMTLRTLAKQSGIQGGSIYYHFGSKQEILVLIMEKTMSELIRRVRVAMDNAKDPLDKLAEAIRAHIQYHTVMRNETYISDIELRSLYPDNYEKIVGMRDSYEQLYFQIIKEGIQKGQGDLIQIKLAVRALLTACTGVYYWFDPEGPLTISEIADAYVEIFFSGIVGRDEK